MNDEVADILEAIIGYCEKIKEAKNKFIPSKDAFDEEAFYRDGIAFYVQQIGEHVKELPPSFEDDHPEVPWHQIRGFRNIIAHAYGNVQPDILWATITEDIPTLSHFCEEYLRDNS